VTPTGLFVYGTLLPGEERWPHLAPLVTGDGVPTSVLGRLYDTGRGYPAAVFDPAGPPVRGRRFDLRADVLDTALGLLDEIEGAVLGLYHRVAVRTRDGHPTWAYTYGDDPAGLRPISTGDWLAR
jgi:gamma-glutamylcyclotransferase (GGCT)/AIG2-like uncharacterized protein YtfP